MPKKKFRVFAREVWVQAYTTTADDEEGAKSAVLNGDGTPEDDTLEFSHMYAIEAWEVEPA